MYTALIAAIRRLNTVITRTICMMGICIILMRIMLMSTPLRFLLVILRIVLRNTNAAATRVITFTVLAVGTRQFLMAIMWTTWLMDICTIPMTAIVTITVRFRPLNVG